VVIEDAVPSANHRPTIPEQVVRESGARPDVVEIGVVGLPAEVDARVLQHAGRSGHRIDGGRVEVRVPIEPIGTRGDDVVAKAEVQRESGDDAIVVLDEGGIVIPPVRARDGGIQTAGRHGAEQERRQAVAGVAAGVLRVAAHRPGEFEHARDRTRLIVVAQVHSKVHAGLDRVPAQHQAHAAGQFALRQPALRELIGGAAEAPEVGQSSRRWIEPGKERRGNDGRHADFLRRIHAVTGRRGEKVLAADRQPHFTKYSAAECVGVADCQVLVVPGLQ
jgi:hypothetical protein